MDEILDEVKVKNNQKSFSKLSLIISLVTFGLLVYLFTSIPKRVNVSEGLPEPPIIIVIATQIFSLIGVIAVILSFTKKEPSSWFKWMGAILNVLLFLMILGSILIARMM